MKSLFELVSFIIFVIVLSYFIKTGCGSDEEVKNRGLKGVFESIWYGDTTTIDTVKE